jgi:iron complex outermembrane recepter protein
VNKCAKVAAVLSSSILFSGIPAVTTFAQSLAADSADSQSDTLTEIVVTAQRREASLERTPVAVAVLTAEALDKQAVTTEGDLQLSVPGLTVRTTENANQLNYSIRGQSVDAFTGSPPAVLPYFNEVQTTNNSSTGFYDLDSIQVLKGPQGTLFGRNATGGAVLFTTVKPTNDLGGYITVRDGNYNYQNVVAALNAPIVSDKLLVRIAGDFEKRDGYDYNLFTHSNVGDLRREGVRLSVLFRPVDSVTNTLVVDYQHSTGTNTPPVAYSVYPPGSTNHGVPLATIGSVFYSPALDAAIGVPGAWTAYLAAHPGANPAGLVAEGAAQKARGPYVVNIDSDLGHKANLLLVSNITTFEVTPNITIKNIFGFQNSSSSDGVDVDGTPFTIEGTGSASQSPIHAVNQDQTFSDELQILGKAFDSRLNYVAGLYTSTERPLIEQNWRIFDLSPALPMPADTIYGAQYRNNTFAGYAQGTYDVSELTGIQGLGFTAGARYTSAKVSEYAQPGYVNYNIPGLPNVLSAKFDRPSWQVGAQDQLTPNELIYVVSRHSFRSGGFNDNAPLTPGTAAQGGAAFGPETTTDVELGSKFQGRLFGIPVRLNVAVYNQWINDIQRSTYASVPGFGLVALTINIPQAQVRGVEADGQISLTSWLDVGGNFAYTDARFTKNQASLFGNVVSYGPYADTPEWSGDVFASANFPLNSVGTLNLRSDVYSATKDYFSSTNNTLSPGTELPGYTIVNFRLGLDNIAGTGLSVAGYVRNAFDRVYYTGGLPNGLNISVNVADPGAPRTYFVEARYRF